jgi:two-component system NtrC family sensor kinase
VDLDLVQRLDALRAGADGPSFPIVALERAADVGRDRLAEIFAAGADDAAPLESDPEALAVRIRALVRRKLVRDENRRIDREWRDQQTSLQRAREETIAAEARASMAEALSRANADLEGANRQLKDAQTKLVQAAKMASLGELVAGIAHEINNPLAFILAHQGTIERLLDELDRETPGRPALEKARQRFASTRLGLKRIEEIIANLRRFSRLDEVEFMTTDVAEGLESVLTLLGHKLSGVEIVRRYEGAPELYCSSALFNQVFMNIVGNAADAMNGEGRIVVSTSSDEERYTIEVADTGPGVPEDLRERVFEPFFTTKPVGAGTGLGLAIAFNVTQAHGGSLSIGEAEGGGACFTIQIPRRTAE